MQSTSLPPFRKKLPICFLLILWHTLCLGQEDSFQKVFVLGNSLTLGFGTHGMAATSPSTDFYFWVERHLRSQNEQLVMSRAKGVKWEAGTSEERIAFAENSVAPFVDGDEDLIIIQLGDNVNSEEKRTTFTHDAIELVNWFHETCPNARVVWVFGWYWESFNFPLLREAQAQSGSFEIIDITGFKYSSNGIFQNRVGNTYINSEGKTDTIKTESTASHPSDIGMYIIASKIIDHLDASLVLSQRKFEPKPVRTTIYSLTGIRLDKFPRNQVYILHEYYSDGTIKVSKGYIKE